jgi:serine protease Do
MAPAQQAVDATVAKVYSAGADSVARLEYSYKNELIGEQPRVGQAVCIDAAKGIFITRDMRSGVPEDELVNFELVGVSGNRVKAEYLGIDPDGSVAFLHVAEKHDWKALAFEPTSALQVGQAVYSVGLLGAQTGNVPYVGIARVSSLVRLPGTVVMVSGGELTITSSPVFNAEGKAIGLVGTQLPLEYSMRLANGQTAEVGLTGGQVTRFFVPSEEFFGLLKQVPEKGKSRKLGWMGVLQFKPVGNDEAQVMGLTGKPAVLVGQVLPGTAAEKAGIKQGDAVIGVNGKPLEALPTPDLTEANFRRTIFQAKPGDKLKLTLWREKAPLDVEVTLDPMPAQPQEAARYYNRNLGIAMRDLVLIDRYAGRATPLETKGVVLIGVVPQSPAEKAQLVNGELVTQVNATNVTNVKDVENILKSVPAGKDVSFTVIRDEKPVVVVVKP